MSFQWYRKHEKAFVWVITIMCVVILGLFSAFSDIEAWLNQDIGQPIAAFEVPATGETVEVSEEEYVQLARSLARTTGGQFGEDQVYVHMMLLADARAAGISVSDRDLGAAIQQTIQQVMGTQGGLTAAEYDMFWRQAGFASRRAFEDLMRERLTTSRYVDLVTQQARVVGVDDVYTVWRIDNELFDVEAAVFPDVDPETIGEPTEAQLRERWDAMSETERETRYREPDKQDVAYGVLPLDADLATLPEEEVLALAEPTSEQVMARFRQLQSVRYQGQQEPDDATRETLARELRVIALATEAQGAFLEEETQDEPTFAATMQAFGLRYEDPEGALGPEQLEALDIGDEILPFYLKNLEVGQTHLVRPFRDHDHTGVVLVQEQVASRPLTFEEAREPLVEDWRDEQRRARARAFRDAIVERARALPDLAEEIEVIEARIEENVEQRLADDPDADAQAVREQERARAEAQIAQRVEQEEGRVWDEVVEELGVETVTLTGLRRDTDPAAGEEDGADPAEAFLARRPQVFALGVDGVTGVLYDAQNEQSVVAKVLDRRFPPKEEMKDDPEGMDVARSQLANERAQNRRSEFTPEVIKANHAFRLIEARPEDETAQG